MCRFAFRVLSFALVSNAASNDTAASRLLVSTGPLGRTSRGLSVHVLQRFILASLWFGLSLAAQSALANPPPLANPQIVNVPFNTAQAFTLTGTDNPPTLMMTFTVATQPIDGVLSGTAPNLTYTPRSGYIGMDSFTFTVTDMNGTSNPATVTLTVEPPPSSSTVIIAFPTAVAVNQSVEFDATVTPINISEPQIGGSILFCDGYNSGTGTCASTLCATAPLSQVSNGATASCIATLHGTGTHIVTALYSGDGVEPQSSSTTGVSVSASITATSITLSAAPTYAAMGENVNLVANVSAGGGPAGTVSFCDGSGANDANFCASGQLLCSNVMLSATAPYVGTCSSVLSSGPHTISAQYSGDAHTSASRGSTDVIVAKLGAVSGNISGLIDGGLVVHLDYSGSKGGGSDDQVIPVGGSSFIFDDSLAVGFSYTVSVGTQPSGQTCSVVNGQGTMPPDGSDVTNVSVTCSRGSTALIAIAHNPDYAAIGQTINYVVTISNTDTSQHTELVNVAMPNQLSNVQWNCVQPGGGLCGVSSGTGASIVQNLSLPAGASALFFVTGTLAADDPSGAARTAVTVTPSIGLAANASDSITVVVFRNGFE